MKLSKIISELFIKKENDAPKIFSNKKTIVIFLLFILGIILVMIPSGNKKTVATQSSGEVDISLYRQNEEKRLNEIFSSIKGVEEAKVYITYADNGVIEVLNEEKTVWKKDGNFGVGSETQSEKKPIYNGDNNTIVKKRNTPTVSGVCIFYRGDDNEKTRDRLFRAAKGALGTQSHKIEVVLLK